MQTIVYVNPLKPGKLEAYKAFTAHNGRSDNHEYIDMLKRYGLKNAKVWYHKLGSTEFVVVSHDAEDRAAELVANFPNSKHPYDQWFIEQLNDLHDFTDAGQAEQLLDFSLSN